MGDGRLDVRPSRAVNHESDRSPADRVMPSDARYGDPGSGHITDHWNVDLAQLRSALPRASWHSIGSRARAVIDACGTSCFSHAVIHVVAGGAKEEMIWVDARWIVAIVQHEKARQIVASPHLICDAMGTLDLAIHPRLTVPISESASHPRPTSRGRVHDERQHELFFGHLARQMEAN